MLSTRSYEETEAYYHTILKGVDPAILMKLIPEDLWPKKEYVVQLRMQDTLRLAFVLTCLPQG